MLLYLRPLLLSFFLLLSSTAAADLVSDTIYLTWQRDPTTTMTIQWVSLPEQNSSLIHYRAEGDPDWQTVEGSLFPMPQGPLYVVHRVELTHLIPQTVYQFQIEENTYLFRTMPAQLTSPIRFVIGGDMYHDGIEFMKETSRQAAKTDPDFAVIGGDIAYAVGGGIQETEKVKRWIEWIQAWHECMITPERRLIPVIAAIGNHDLNGQFGQTPEQALLFSTLFPMPGKQIYNVLDFDSYLSLFLLDSGHANPINGAQTDWLKNSLQKRQNIPTKLAIYHVPAYPSIRPFYGKYSLLIRRHWVPLFEQYGIHLAFEHHDHAYKRTHPLLNNRVNPKGIIYLGDGAWGVEQPRHPRFMRKLFYIDQFSSTRHFILFTLDQNGQQIKSISSQGQVLDAFSRPFPSPQVQDLGRRDF